MSTSILLPLTLTAVFDVPLCPVGSANTAVLDKDKKANIAVNAVNFFLN
jgi:hypothetical protein